MLNYELIMEDHKIINIIFGLLLIIITIAIMGFSDFFKTKQNGNVQFVSAQHLKDNIAKQTEGAPKVMEQLRQQNITQDKELKLEYFFYTNTNEKAKMFAPELEKLNYTVKYGQSAGDKNLFVITGLTTKMKMTNEIVVNWSKQMCELGYKFDCDFDGWGASLDQ